MNISPINNVNYFRFNQRVNDKNEQTEPQELKQPSFKMNNKSMMLLGSTILGTTIACGINAAKNLNTETETQFPTREEFEAMMKNDGVDIFLSERWLKRYDKNAEKMIAFYNMFKQAVNTEDDNGLLIFSIDNASIIAETSRNYQKGLTKMLSMRDDFGNLRFKKTKDYIAARVFEKYPEEAEKYANMRDELGNYRFDGDKIDAIIMAKMLTSTITKDPDITDVGYHNYVDCINVFVEARANGSIKPEDIDSILNLKREDGSYVFNNLPSVWTIKRYLEDPKMFSEISNIKTLGENKYVKSGYIAALMHLYKRLPEETKHLLQMSFNGYNSPRFSEDEIAGTPEAVLYYKNAPRAFMSFASLEKDVYDDHKRFSLSDICKIIDCTFNEGDEITELSKEDIKAINELARIRVRDVKSAESYYLKTDKICELFNIYKQHPAEVKEILENYITEGEWGYDVALIPNESDMELYINNRAEFDRLHKRRPEYK